MKLLYTTVASILLSCSANATEPLALTTSWDRVFGGRLLDQFNDVIPTQDGGNISVGTVYTADSGEDVGGDVDMEQVKGRTDGVIVKYDALGNIEWQKIYGGSGEDYFDEVEQLIDGSYVTIGRSDSYDGDLDNDNLDQKDTGVVVGFDIEGNILWSANDYSSVNGYSHQQVSATADGGFAVAGVNYSNESVIFLKKYDADRNIEWEVNYPRDQIFNLESMIATNDGGFALSGSVFLENWDGVLLKTDAAGAVVWEYRHAPLSTDEFFEVIQTSEGDFVVTGVEGATTSFPDIPHVPFAVKVDMNGNQVWRTDLLFDGYPLKDYYGETYTSIVELPSGGFALAGTIYSNFVDPDEDLGISDGLLTILDKDGTEQSQQIFGGVFWDRFESVAQATDGNLLVSGATEGTSGDITDTINGDRDGLLVKFDLPASL